MPFFNFKSGQFNIKTIAIALGILFVNIFLFVLIFASDGVGQYIFRTISFILVATLCAAFVQVIYLCTHEHERLIALGNDLANAQAKLSHIEESWDRLIAIVAIELRTPLQVIRGYSSMIISGNFGSLGDEARRMVQTIGELSEKISGATEELISTSTQAKNEIISAKDGIQYSHLGSFWSRKTAFLNILVLSAILLLIVQFFLATSTTVLFMLMLSTAGFIFLCFYVINEVRHEPESEGSIALLETSLGGISKQIETASEQKNLLVTRITTNIREPISTIMSLSTRLAEDSFGETTQETKEAAGKIFEASDRFSTTISSIVQILNA